MAAEATQAPEFDERKRSVLRWDRLLRAVLRKNLVKV
jgi:hypothetical protein